MGRRANSMKPKKQEVVEEVVETKSVTVVEKTTVEEPKFSKKQFVTSRKYAKVKDYLNGNLEDDRLYTIKEVDEIVNKLYNKVR